MEKGIKNVKVGDNIENGGETYVIARIWDHEDCVDLQVINKRTGEFGSLRINKLKK